MKDKKGLGDFVIGEITHTAVDEKGATVNLGLPVQYAEDRSTIFELPLVKKPMGLQYMIKQRLANEQGFAELLKASINNWLANQLLNDKISQIVYKADIENNVVHVSLGANYNLSEQALHSLIDHVSAELAKKYPIEQTHHIQPSDIIKRARGKGPAKGENN